MEQFAEVQEQLAKLCQRFAVQRDKVTAFVRRLVIHSQESAGWDFPKRGVLVMGPSGTGKSYFFQTACLFSQVFKHCFTVDATSLLGLARARSTISAGEVMDCLCLSGGIPLSHWGLAGQTEEERPALLVLDNLDELILQLNELSDPYAGIALQRALAIVLTRAEWRFSYLLARVGYSEQERRGHPEVVYTWPLFPVGVGRFEAVVRTRGLEYGDNVVADVPTQDMVRFGMDRALAECFDTTLVFKTYTEEDILKILTEQTNSPVSRMKEAFCRRGLRLDMEQEALQYLIQASSSEGRTELNAVERACRKLWVHIDSLLDGKGSPDAFVVTINHVRSAGIGKPAEAKERPVDIGGAVPDASGPGELIPPSTEQSPPFRQAVASLAERVRKAGDSVRLCAGTAGSLGGCRLVNRLGQGSAGELWEARGLADSAPRVVQILHLGDAAQALSLLRGWLPGPPSLAGLYSAAVLDPQHLLLEWEWSSAGTLDRQEETFSPPEVVTIGRQVCQALADLHGAGGPVPEPNPANLLLRQRQPLQVALGGYDITTAAIWLGASNSTDTVGVEAEPSRVLREVRGLAKVLQSLLASPTAPAVGAPLVEVLRQASDETREGYPSLDLFAEALAAALQASAGHGAPASVGAPSSAGNAISLSASDHQQERGIIP